MLRKYFSSCIANDSIHFPGSRQYASVGDIENSEEVGDAAPADVVKVMGTKEATSQAAESLKVRHMVESSLVHADAKISTERPQRATGGKSTPDFSSRPVAVANKYYHALADTPNLIRSIRAVGGNLTIPQPAPPKPTVARPISDGASSLAAKAARIDLGAENPEDDIVVEGEWEIRENHGDGVDGELEWIVRAKEEDLEKAVAALEKAVDHVKAATHGMLSPSRVVENTLMSSRSMDWTSSICVPTNYRIKGSHHYSTQGRDRGGHSSWKG